VNAMSEIAKCQLCELEGTLECGHCKSSYGSPFQEACRITLAFLLTPMFAYLFVVAGVIDWLRKVS
jgi:hypothetical protein